MMTTPPKAIPYIVETDIPIPKQAHYMSPERKAIGMLLDAPDEASIFFPWNLKIKPVSQLGTLGKHAARVLGKGNYTIRSVEGGIRVWKGKPKF